jgi:hypothetical protein
MRAFTTTSPTSPTSPTVTTPLIRSQPPTSSGIIRTLTGLFGTSPLPPETGRHAHAIQRSDQWLQQLGADTESRAIASQHPELQSAMSALLDADPPVVELRTQDGETSCVFVEPGPTQDSLNYLASIGRQLLQLNNPAAARLLATAAAAARQGFPDREAQLLRDSGLALQNSKASLPFQTLMALCVRTAELVDLGFMKQDDGLLFEAAACRSPQGAPYGLNLCLRRLRTALKALLDQPAQDRPADAMARLGREIDGLHQRCRVLDQREPAEATVQLLTDLVTLAHGTPAHTTLSTTLDRLIDAQRRFFDTPLGVAAWYPGLLEGGDPRLAAQAYQQRLDASAEPAVRHGQLCNCLSTLVQQGPDRPWSTWAAHLDFAARAFPQQHDARFDVALCVDWVCARPGDAAERLDSLWACLATAPAPHKALRLHDMERLLELMLSLPAEASAKAFDAYMARVHPKLNRRLEPVGAVLNAYRQLSSGKAPREVLENLVARLRQGKYGMAHIPEWDFLVRRLLGRLLARDKSIDMANSLALRTLLLDHAVSAEDPLAALDNTIDLMRTLWQSVQASASVHVPSGAPADHLPDFCTVLRTHLRHRFGFGGHDPETANGKKRHAEQLMDACLTAQQVPAPLPAQASTVSLAPPEFPDVYASLVRARLAQRHQDAHANDLVQQTVNLHTATLKNKPYLQRLDRQDPAWKDYSARLQDMAEALDL